MWVFAVSCAHDDADAVNAALWTLGVNGVEQEDEETGGPAGVCTFRVWLAPDTDHAAVEDAVRARVAAGGSLGALRFGWSRVTTGLAGGSWPIGAGFRVCALGGSRPRSSRRATLAVDHAAAWGDGRHGSTRAVIALLELQAAAILGARAVDFGCGSGLLGLELVTLGAASVLAVDHDGLARDATRRAAAACARGDAITVVEGLPPALEADVLVANLPHLVLRDGVGRLAQAVAPQGALVLAGSPRALWPEVAAALPGWRVGAARRSGAFGAWWLVRAPETNPPR